MQKYPESSVKLPTVEHLQRDDLLCFLDFLESKIFGFMRRYDCFNTVAGASESKFIGLFSRLSLSFFFGLYSSVSGFPAKLEAI
jgi:hypothetical protein